MTIDEQLQELQQQINRQQTLRNKLQTSEQQRNQLNEKLMQLEQIMHAEQKDVDKLLGHSLSKLFASINGSLDEKLSKEQQEARTAEVKYEAARSEMAALEEDIVRKQTEIAGLNGCDRKFAELLERKKNEIRSNQSAASKQIIELEQNLAFISNQRREIQEALSAGRSARGTADSILSSLNSAEGWGTWDVLGGGLLSDLAKHDHLDRAQSMVNQLQNQLSKFKTELTDINISSNLQVQVDGFLRFADYFFDGIFADWAVLDRIGKSKQQVQSTKHQIEQVLNRLDDLHRSAESKIVQLKQQISELVLNA